MITINWQGIDTILLDMDGTLLDLHFDNYFWQFYLPAAYARQQGLLHEQAERCLFEHFDRIHGTLDWYNLDYWQQQLQLDIVGLKKEVQHLIAVRPGVWEFLGFLRAHKKRSILVTNAHPESLRLKMEITGVGASLDQLVSTHDYGAPKEELVFWERLSTVEPFDPARTLFIDDTPRILDIARCFGVSHLLAVLQPDSRGEPKKDAGYPRLEHFRQIFLK